MKILVICGGGVFGIIPAYLLSKVHTGKMFQWDAFAGTSVGSELVLSYAYGRTPEFVYDLFMRSFDDIFDKPWYRSLYPWGSKYPDKELNKSLQELIPEYVRFMDIKKPVIVPTYNFKHGKPKVFDNIIEDKDFYMKAWEVARASSAAPTYFPPYLNYIDGGIVANNATVVTAWALHNKLGIPYSEMEILTIGTGQQEHEILDMEAVKSWSSLKWLDPMLDMLTLGNEQMWDFGADELGLKKYVFFNPIKLDGSWKLDETSIIPEIITECDGWMEEFEHVYGEFVC